MALRSIGDLAIDFARAVADLETVEQRHAESQAAVVKARDRRDAAQKALDERASRMLKAKRGST